MAKATITKEILGDPKGKKLFIVTRIDLDDYEDTQTELWRADDEDGVYDLVKLEYTSEEDPEHEDYDDVGAEVFDEDWGYRILCKEIGEINQ